MQNVIVTTCAYIEYIFTFSMLGHDGSGMAKQTESLDNEMRAFHSFMNMRTSKYSVPMKKHIGWQAYI